MASSLPPRRASAQSHGNSDSFNEKIHRLLDLGSLHVDGLTRDPRDRCAEGERVPHPFDPSRTQASSSAVQTTVKSHCSLNILRAADLGKAKVCQAPWGPMKGLPAVFGLTQTRRTREIARSGASARGARGEGERRQNAPSAFDRIGRSIRLERSPRNPTANLDQLRMPAESGCSTCAGRA